MSTVGHCLQKNCLQKTYQFPNELFVGILLGAFAGLFVAYLVIFMDSRIL